MNHGIILDAFCGLGGDIIHLSKRTFSIGCDIDRDRLLDGRIIHEAVGSNRVEYILCDSMRGISCFRSNAFDLVYLSPPWGHQAIRNRRKAPVFGLRSLRSLAVDGFEAFTRALRLCRNRNICYYLPRGMDVEELKTLAALTGDPDRMVVDIHASFDPDDETVPDASRYKVRAITIYFGELADQ